MQIFVAKVDLLILYLDRCLIYLDYFLRILNPESKYCTKKTFQHIYGHCLAAQRTFDLLAQRCPNNQVFIKSPHSVHHMLSGIVVLFYVN